MSHAHEPASRTLAGALTVVLTLLAWSSVPLFLRHFRDLVDPWTSNGWRYGISAVLLAPVLAAYRMRGGLPPGIWRAALVPSIANAAGQVCFCYAHYRIEPGLLSFGLRTQIVFSALGAYVLLAAERPLIRSPGYLAGAAAVMAGTAGAVLLGEGPPGGAHAAGVGLAVLSGALFSAYALAVRHYMRGFRSAVSFAVISLYTAAALVALMVLLGRGAGLAALELPRGEFLLLLVSGVIGIGIGHVLYYMSIARLGVAASSGVIQLQPVAVGAASAYLFRESLTAAQWASGAVAVVGALLMLGVQARRGGAR
jgi:drug/metabolite transporter (DMT)-like permease